MLSAAVILVVFAVIALAGAGSAVWLYRTALASAWRAQPAPRQLPVESAVAAGVTARATADPAGVPDPGWPGPSAGPGSGRPASQETTPVDDKEFGVVWEAPVGVTADHAGPPAAPEQVYDLAEWPDLDSAGDGPEGSGPRGPRAWPDLARSLYSRGWPAMDSPPSAASGWPRSGPLPHPEPDGHNSGGPGSDGPGSDSPNSDDAGWDGAGWDSPGSGSPGSDGAGWDGAGWDSPGSGSPGSGSPGSGGRRSDGAGWDGAGWDSPRSGSPGSGGPGSGSPGSGGAGSDSLNPISPHPSGPERDGPASDRPDSDGPDSDGPDSDGPDSDGPDSDGPDSDGPDSDGPDSDGTERPRDEGNGSPPGPRRGSAKVYVLGGPRRPRP